MKRAKATILKKASTSKKPTTLRGPPRESCPVVGIGASAGGLDAISQLLSGLPSNTGMAFVVIQHLDPGHASILSEFLVKTTKMPVHEVRDGMAIKPNHVYVIPPSADLGITRGLLTLVPRVREAHRPHMPIDRFFSALAADRGRQAIGVVLSGTATDGTEGLRSIQATDGVTFAQDPRSAKFRGMPESAVAAGVVDACLTVPDIAESLARLALHPYVRTLGAITPPGAKRDEDVGKILVQVHRATGVDFGEYKGTTVQRRIARRMALRRIVSMDDYARLLQTDAAEVRALHEDILIHVTSFFRDAEVFEDLKEHAFPAIMKYKAPGAPVRIWVAGCASGEEVYSVAIALLEYLGDAAAKTPFQIFGSDLSEAAIERARMGLYPESAVRELSRTRLRHFFARVDGGYRISKLIRDVCIFARHDLARDPPFSKVDLVTCRNVLIYFGPALQRRVLATFHYALNPHGFLLLGRTENISSHAQLFSTADKTSKLFAKTTAVAPGALRLARAGDVAARGRSPAELRLVPPVVDVGRRVDNLLLAQYAPPGVIVNEQMEILHFRGRTGHYLEAPAGQPQSNLLKMARGGLLAELRLAIGRAAREMTTVRTDRVQVHQDGTTRTCNLVVTPIPGTLDARERLFVVLFEEGSAAPFGLAAGVPARGARSNGKKPVVAKATGRDGPPARELRATKEYLQALIAERQQTHDALTATNDELSSSNEELQSMNEELETAKEELQSTNEELSTVNEELQNRNQELGQVNNDLVNLLNSVEIPIVILDAKRCVRRFTPRARAIMNLLPTDVGRPINDIRPNVVVEDLDRQIAEVIETVTPKDWEVQDRDGRWHRLQVRPYKTVDNKIDGAVLSLVDIDALKRTLADAEWARDYARSIVEAVQAPLVVLDDAFNVVSANQAFYDYVGAARTGTESHSIFDVGLGAPSTANLRVVLGAVLAKGVPSQGAEVEDKVPNRGARTLSFSARPVYLPNGAPLILLAIEDTTDRTRRERERAEILRQAEEARAAAEQASWAKDTFLATLSHELRTPLSTLLLQAQLLGRTPSIDPTIKRACVSIERAAKTQAQLVDDLLDVSRIITGKLSMDFRDVDLGVVVRAAADAVSATAERKPVALALALATPLRFVSGDPARLQQVVSNLLTNAIKFTPAGGNVTVTLEPANGRAQLRVTDTGAGIEPAFLPYVFDRFTQADSSNIRIHGGLGLGLAIVRHIVEMHGGTVRAESPGKDHGTTFVVTLSFAEARPGTDVPVETLRDTGEHLAAEAQALPELNGLKILVVDDDDGTREALTTMLTQTGADVRDAASATDAMQVFDAFAPQVLLCDIAMPDEDGYHLLQSIRQRGPALGGDVPAVAITALAGEDDRRRAFAAGFQMHIAKPLEFDRLAVSLKRLQRQLARNAASDRDASAPATVHTTCSS